MISLRIFLLIIVTLVCREFAESRVGEVASLNGDLLPAAIRATCFVLGFGLLFKSMVTAFLANSGIDSYFAKTNHRTSSVRHYAFERTSQFRRIVESLWLGCLPAALLLTGWGDLLASAEVAGALRTLVLASWFLPSFVFILLLEVTSAQVDDLFVEQPITGGGSANGHWSKELLLRLRLGELTALATCLAPVLLVSALTDVIELLAGRGEESVWLIGLATSAAILAFGLSLPVLLGRWMQAKPLPEPDLHRRVTAFCRSLGIRGLSIKMVDGEKRWHGAAVVGWLPGFRQLWLGGSLVENLPREELDMVIMHELAHVRRQHFVWRVAPILVAACVFTAGMAISGVPQIPPATLATWPIVATGLTALLCLVVGLSLAAHACELDADRQACALAVQVCDWVKKKQDAASALAKALERLTIGSGSRRTTWLHPSLQRRLNNLVQKSP